MKASTMRRASGKAAATVRALRGSPAGEDGQDKGKTRAPVAGASGGLRDAVDGLLLAWDGPGGNLFAAVAALRAARDGGK